jgi:large subunit ribosomal protein L6
MSRVGKIPIPVPSGVTVTTDGTTVTAKGPKGELVRKLSGGVIAKVEGGNVRLERGGNEAQDKALHGMYRSIVKGMVDGVSKGYEKRLEVVGVSYQAAIEGGKLKLNVGFSNPVLLPIPKTYPQEPPGRVPERHSDRRDRLGQAGRR